MVGCRVRVRVRVRVMVGFGCTVRVRCRVEALRASGASNDAQIDLWLSELRIFTRDQYVTPHGKLQR